MAAQGVIVATHKDYDCVHTVYDYGHIQGVSIVCSTKYEFDKHRVRPCCALLSPWSVGRQRLQGAASDSLDRIYASCEIARHSCSDVGAYCH
jgi:hypothetical protein